MTAVSTFLFSSRTSLSPELWPAPETLPAIPQSLSSCLPAACSACAKGRLEQTSASLEPGDYPSTHRATSSPRVKSRMHPAKAAFAGNPAREKSAR